MPSHYFVALKTFLSYLVFGRRRPRWDLQLQLFCDVVRNHTIFLFPESTDNSIEGINYNDIGNFYKRNPMPTTEVNPDTGVYAALNIEASKVHIDRDKLAGFGLGEEALHALIEEDKQIIDHDVASSRLLCGRLVPFELVASWNACEGYEGISRTGDYSKALDPHPLSENEKIILYFHGGSYLLGGPYSHREHIGEMCKATKMRTFSIDYRLAPLNPFPAQLHDALISFNYMLDLGFKPSNIILAGDSAGGHLSLDLFLLLRHGFLPKGTNVRGIILLSPMPGLSLKGKSLQYNRDFDYLTPIPTEWPTSPIRLLYRPGQKYTPGYLSELESPILTPANGSMADMPPTLIQCGTCEILVDDVRRLRDKIKEDNPDMGDQIIYEEYPDMFHVFHRLLYREESKQAFEQITAFVNSLK